MPAFDQTINSLSRPWLIKTYEFSGPSGSPVVVLVDQNAGYPSLPCRNFRTTTNRNPFLTGKAFRKPFKLILYEWYRGKPPPIRLVSKGVKSNILITDQKAVIEILRKELYKAKQDWRRSRPVRSKPKPKRIPEGWHFESLPTGELRLRADGRDPRSGITRFEWLPVLRNVLRPSDRKWLRGGKAIPREAKINDLTFFRQTGYVDGLSELVCTLGTTQPIINQPYPDPGDVNFTGSFRLLGHYRFVPWTEYGFSTDDPFSSLTGLPDDRSAEDHAALVARWSDEVSQVERIALRRHYSKLANKKVDLAVALGEGLKTVNSIASAAKRIGSALLSLKKGNIANSFRQLFPTSPKEVANDYLAWKYGLKPLISDLQGATEHLVEYITSAQPYKSNGHAKKDFEKISSFQLGSPSPIGTSGVYEVRKAKIRVKFGTVFSFPDKLKRQAASLGFTNPANVAWELVPFSFVADWFLPIGDFLSNLSSLHGLTVKESYRTVFIREEVDRYTFLNGYNGVMPTEGPSFPTPGSSRGASGHVFFVSSYSQMHRETIFCERKVIPLPGLPLPEFKNPLSRGHLHSAMALFTQLFSK